MKATLHADPGGVILVRQSCKWMQKISFWTLYANNGILGLICNGSTFLLLVLCSKQTPASPKMYLTVPCPILSYPILSYPVLSYAVLSYPAHPILPYPILSYHIPSYPVLSYPILSYPILSHPILCYVCVTLGHSRTIVGVEEYRDGTLKLLIFDPSCNKRQMNQFVSGSSEVSNNLMKSLRRTIVGLKAKQYQIVAVVGLLSDADYEVGLFYYHFVHLTPGNEFTLD